MSAPALLILSAAFHALWNATLKRSKNKLGTALSFMIVATILNAVFAAAAATMPPFSTVLLSSTIAAGVFEGVYFYLLNTAYAKQSLGVAYTIMRGGAMVLVWIISALALGESIGRREVIAALTILSGIACIQQTFKLSEFLASGAYAAYACGGCIAGYHICYGLAVRTDASPSFVFAAAMSIGVVTYITCSRGAALGQVYASLTRERALVFFGGASCGLSFLLFLTALTMVEPGRAISLRNTSVVFGAAISLLMGEHLKRIQRLGVVLVTAGVFGLL
jgi:drug/metabolite transporter (DMT)-like permease